MKRSTVLSNFVSRIADRPVGVSRRCRLLSLSALVALAACDTGSSSPDARATKPDAAQAKIAIGSQLVVELAGGQRELTATPIDLQLTCLNCDATTIHRARIVAGELANSLSLSPGRYRIDARADGYVVDIVRELQVTGAQQTTRLRLGIARTGEAIVRIADRSHGRPIVDASVHLRSVDDKAADEITLHGKDGAFWASDLAPGRYNVKIDRAGSCIADLQTIEIRHATQRFDLDLAASSAVSGVLTALATTTPDQLAATIVEFSGPDGSGAVRGRMQDDGRFEISDVCGKRGILHIRTPGHAPYWRSEVEVDDLRAGALQVELTAGLTLDLLLRDVDGVPMANTTVEIEYAGFEVDPRRRVVATTNEHGQLHVVDLAAHPRTLTVRPENQASWTASFESLASQLQAQEIRLPALHQATMKIVDDIGNPLAGASVKLRQQTRDLGTWKADASGVVQIATYEVEALEAIVRAPGHVATRQPWQADLPANAAIALQRTATFELCLPTGSNATSAVPSTALELVDTRTTLLRRFDGDCATIAAIVPGHYRYRTINEARRTSTSSWQSIDLVPGDNERRVVLPN